MNVYISYKYMCIKPYAYCIVIGGGVIAFLAMRRQLNYVVDKPQNRHKQFSSVLQSLHKT